MLLLAKYVGLEWEVNALYVCAIWRLGVTVWIFSSLKSLLKTIHIYFLKSYISSFQQSTPVIFVSVYLVTEKFCNHEPYSDGAAEFTGPC